MVSFVCNYCQATLKKPKLDQHAQRCYNATFSCIDCNTDFVGDTYRQHTACMTEEQKYKNKMAAKNIKKPTATAAVPKSTVEQLKEKQTQAASDVVPAKTPTKKRKHEKSGESASSEEKKSKDKSAKGKVPASWDDSVLPTTPAGALASAITFAFESEPDVAFAELKKKCVKMVAKHPKCTFSKSDVKEEFAAAVLAALSEGKVKLTKC